MNSNKSSPTLQPRPAELTRSRLELHPVRKKQYKPQLTHPATLGSRARQKQARTSSRIHTLSLPPKGPLCLVHYVQSCCNSNCSSFGLQGLVGQHHGILLLLRP